MLLLDLPPCIKVSLCNFFVFLLLFLLLFLKLVDNVSLSSKIAILLPLCLSDSLLQLFPLLLKQNDFLFLVSLEFCHLSSHQFFVSRLVFELALFSIFFMTKDAIVFPKDSGGRLCADSLLFAGMMNVELSYN